MDPRAKPGTTEQANSKIPLSPADLQRLLELIKTVRYGSITLVIQDGRVVQIDKNEKMRLK